MNLGQKIKKLRQEKGYTQVQLAKILNISRQALSHYEMNDRDLSTDLIKKICIIFDISADELLEIETQEERKRININNSFNGTLNNNNINF